MRELFHEKILQSVHGFLQFPVPAMQERKVCSRDHTPQGRHPVYIKFLPYVIVRNEHYAL